MKEFLSRAGVPFVARNVEEDDAAYRELMGRGWRTVPVTVAGAGAVRGFDPAALSELVRAVAALPPDR